MDISENSSDHSVDMQREKRYYYQLGHREQIVRKDMRKAAEKGDLEKVARLKQERNDLQERRKETLYYKQIILPKNEKKKAGT